MNVKEIRERDITIIYEGWPTEQIETERFVRITPEERDALVEAVEAAHRLMGRYGLLHGDEELVGALAHFDFGEAGRQSVSERISIPALRKLAMKWRGPERGSMNPDLFQSELLALVEAVEAAHRRQSVRGPLGETIRERADAEQALDDALARFDFASEAQRSTDGLRDFDA